MLEWSTLKSIDTNWSLEGKSWTVFYDLNVVRWILVESYFVSPKNSPWVRKKNVPPGRIIPKYPRCEFWSIQQVEYCHATLDFHYWLWFRWEWRYCWVVIIFSNSWDGKYEGSCGGSGDFFFLIWTLHNWLHKYCFRWKSAWAWQPCVKGKRSARSYCNMFHWSVIAWRVTFPLHFCWTG